MRRTCVVTSIGEQIYNLLRRHNNSPYTFIANTHCCVGFCNVCWWRRHLYFHSVGPRRLRQYWGSALWLAQRGVRRRCFDRLCHGWRCRRQPGIADGGRLWDVAGIATESFIAFQVGILRICLDGNQRGVSLGIHGGVNSFYFGSVLYFWPTLFLNRIHYGMHTQQKGSQQIWKTASLFHKLSSLIFAKDVKHISYFPHQWSTATLNLNFSPSKFPRFLVVGMTNGCLIQASKKTKQNKKILPLAREKVRILKISPKYILSATDITNYI